MIKGDYPENWKEIADRVKESAEWACVRCDHPHDPAAGYCLTVHHLDMNPANCKWWNLVALCQRCHLQIQNKVVMAQYYMFEHSEWFKPYVAGYLSNLLNWNESKEWVIGDADWIIEAYRILTNQESDYEY